MYYSSLIWQFLLNSDKRAFKFIVNLYNLVLYWNLSIFFSNLKLLLDNLISKSNPYKETFVWVLARQECSIKEVGRILLHRLDSTYRRNTICSIIYWPVMIALEAIFLLSKSNKILSLLWDLWGQIILILFKLIWRMSACNSF